MIPLRDANPTTRRPLVTWGLLAANIAVFLLWQPISGSQQEQGLFFYCNGRSPKR